MIEIFLKYDFDLSIRNNLEKSV